MTPTGVTEDDACMECMRRSWLLGELSRLLDYHRGDVSKLLKLLALNDEALINSIAGRRRAELTDRWERFELDELEVRPGIETACMHGPHYPRALLEHKARPGCCT